MLEEGQQAEVCLDACGWIENAGRALGRGFVMTIDYGHEARALYNEGHNRGTLLAYRDTCASCGGTLHDGQLRGGALACRHCERSFFLPRAGRSMDDDKLQLEPVPLLREQGRVKVALAG